MSARGKAPPIRTFAGEEILKGAFEPATTVSHLKRLIADTHPCKEVKLLRNEEQLGDTATLATLDLQSGDILQAVLDRFKFTADQYHNLQWVFHMCPGADDGEVPFMNAIAALCKAKEAGFDIGVDHAIFVTDYYDDSHITLESRITPP